MSGQGKCGWLGIKCDEDSRVVAIELYNNNLSGLIPDEIGFFASTLKILDLEGNLFDCYGDEGTKWMGTLVNLGKHGTGFVPTDLWIFRVAHHSFLVFSFAT